MQRLIWEGKEGEKRPKHNQLKSFRTIEKKSDGDVQQK